MADRSHLSIGEVLSLLREEFPDVTISKIRFLESQGLVDPERTPSGYRKFYDHDVERLRWILRQQREHFLPLKVIRGRLTEQTGPEGETEDDDQPDFEDRTPVTSGAPARGRTPEAGTGPGGERPDGPSRERADSGSAPSRPAPPAAMPSLFAGLHTHQPEEPGTGPAAAAPNAPAVTPSEAGPTASGPGRPGRAVTANEGPPAPSPSPSPSPSPAPAPAPSPPPGLRSDEPDTYTAEELAAAIGTDPALISDLKQYGLIAPHAVVAGTQYYDPSAVGVARAAAQFARHGVEARHLRTWRNAADREADLFQQVVLPLLRQRNPQARRQAADTLADLARAGAELRAALVDKAIRDIR